MRYILILLFLSSCTHPTRNVDVIHKINTCPSVVGVDSVRPGWESAKGTECNQKNMKAMMSTIAGLVVYSEGLELENKRLNDSIKRCREGK